MAFFTVYLDDSGTAPDQPIANASALIIPGKQVLKLDSHWERFVKSQGIPDFHASACAAAPGTKEKKYHHLDSDAKKHIFMRVRQFCKSYGVQTFGFSVYKKSFDSIVKEGFRNYVGNHYTFALRHTLRNIEQWRRRRGIKEPLRYIFDWQDFGTDPRDEIDDVIGQMCEQYKEKVFHDFKLRASVPGLQCVDLIAWLTLQLGLNNFHDKPMHGLAGECIKDFENHYPSGLKQRPGEKWFQVATVQKPHLEKWFEVEMKLGKSIKWFEDWYKRHPNREALLHARKKRIQKLLKARETTDGSPAQLTQGQVGS